ncbi:hypothetical protein [Streptomyces sp. NPDC006333]|uniref:hypothetical protein n=1 Tax=unclassified Streptomyces TaxID=2593676 RepID=UPI0033ACC9D0
MSPKLKVTRNRRQDEGTASRHPRLSARAAALIVLGTGVVGLWSAPMAQAAGHESHRTFHSSVTFNVPRDVAEADAAEDLADYKDAAGIDSADYLADYKDAAGVDGAEDLADYKDAAEADAAEDLAYLKGGADFYGGRDLWDYLDDGGLHITVNVNNNNNNNNNGGNANNNNNNGGGTNTNNN